MEYMCELPALVHVTHVEVIGDHELRLTFEDRTVGDVAFEQKTHKDTRRPVGSEGVASPSLPPSSDPTYDQPRHQHTRPSPPP
jgi:hypothetical protein